MEGIRLKEYAADIAIIGGSVGGCAAALAACRAGLRVIMTEVCDWIGGQLTSQAVPADEHRYIESFGATSSYRDFRRRVRAYYRDRLPLTAEARAIEHLNPGGGNVSRLCCDMRVALAVLYDMLAPYLHTGRLTLLQAGPRGAAVQGDRVLSVAVDLGGETAEIAASYFLDATEEGDLLPLTGCAYITGDESAAETGEPHAPAEADPANLQGITYCFAAEYRAGERHVIHKPAMYDFWRAYAPTMTDGHPWPGRLLSWTYTQPRTLEPLTGSLYGGAIEFFRYRQIVDAGKLTDKDTGDVTLINWPQNDYFIQPIIDVAPEQRARALYEAKQLSLSLLYWLQTEAPRHDGGEGYPELRLRPDIVGTADGLAQYPYIRESRRIRAEYTVTENHISPAVNPDTVARFPDSVGVGSYGLDLHPSTRGRNYIDIPALPFEIPLGSLIPERIENLLPACKNLGVTHITNGCYREHPTEWNIGEAAGALAAFCLRTGASPRAVRSGRLTDFQAELTARHGFELHWPEIRRPFS